MASTWLNETAQFSPDVIEKQLAHESADSVRAAYNRAEYMEQRRRMMQVWADHVEATAAKTAAPSVASSSEADVLESASALRPTRPRAAAPAKPRA